MSCSSKNERVIKEDSYSVSCKRRCLSSDHDSDRKGEHSRRRDSAHCIDDHVEEADCSRSPWKHSRRKRVKKRPPSTSSDDTSVDSTYSSSSSDSSSAGTHEKRHRKHSKKEKKRKMTKKKRKSSSDGGPVQLSKYIDERRSAVSGRVIKMKVKKSSKDKQREKNRKQLLAFLNASTD